MYYIAIIPDGRVIFFLLQKMKAIGTETKQYTLANRENMMQLKSVQYTKTLLFSF